MARNALPEAGTDRHVSAGLPAASARETAPSQEFETLAQGPILGSPGNRVACGAPPDHPSARWSGGAPYPQRRQQLFAVFFPAKRFSKKYIDFSTCGTIPPMCVGVRPGLWVTRTPFAHQSLPSCLPTS